MASYQYARTVRLWKQVVVMAALGGLTMGNDTFSFFAVSLLLKHIAVAPYSKPITSEPVRSYNTLCGIGE
jgi:hypothetical protein